MEERVGVVEKTETGFTSGTGGAGGNVPAVKLLRDASELVVVSIESVERAEPKDISAAQVRPLIHLPSPSCAKSLGGVASETTRISSDHTHTVNRRETEHLADSGDVLLPRRDVVTQPKTAWRSGEGRSSDRERLLSRSSLLQSVTRDNGVSRAVEVVLVVGSRAIGLEQVGSGGEVGDVLQTGSGVGVVALRGSLTTVLDHVRRVKPL